MSRLRYRDDQYDSEVTEISSKQMKSILSFASEQFDTPVKTPHELKTEISRISHQLKKSTGQSKSKHYKLKIEELEKQINEKDTKLLELETKLRELQDDSSRKIAELEQENIELKANQPIEASLPEAAFEQFDVMEDVLHTQAEEIKQLCDQRDFLLNNVRSYDKAISSVEEIIRNAKQTSDDSRQTISLLKKELDEAKQILPSICTEIQQMLPEDFPNYSGNPREFLVNTVQRFITQPKVQDPNPILVEKHKSLVSELDGAVRFIQSLANGVPNSEGNDIPLGADPTVRTLILTQAARINRFIDENELEVGDSPNVYSPNVEDQLKAFMSLASGSDITTSPVRELFALFTTVTDINKLMMNYVDQLKAELGKSQTTRNYDEENDHIRDEYDLACAELQQKVEEIQKVFIILSDLNNSPAETLEDVANHTADLVLQLQEEIKTLRGNEQKVNQKKEEVTKLMDKAAQLEQKIQSIQDDHSKQLSLLHDQLKDSDSKDAASQARIQQLEDELAGRIQAIKKAKKEQSETARLIDQIQERADQLIAENQNLAEKNHSLELETGDLQQEVIKLTEKQKRYKQQKHDLVDRLQQSENENKTMLNDIKRRNEELRQKYDDRLQKLTDDLQIARKQLSDSNAAKTSLVKEKVELMANLAKVKVSERALKLKAAALQEKQSIDQSTKSARENSYLMSLKTQANLQIEDYKTEMENVRLSLLRILEIQFKQPQPNDQTINGAIRELEEKIHLTISDQKVLSDAINLRKTLKLASNTSLSSAYQQLMNDHNLEKVALEEARQNAIEKKEALDRFKRSQRQMIDDAKEANEWEKWGQSMYRQVAEGAAGCSKQDLRFLLEEALLASIGHRTLIRKLETLRTQKKILAATQGKVLQSQERKSGIQKVMFKQLFVAITFMTRVRIISGHCQHPLPVAAPMMGSVQTTMSEEEDQ